MGYLRGYRSAEDEAEGLEISLRRRRQITNYNSHNWRWVEISTTEHERACICQECGCENRGDPREFNDLEYPNCSSVF